MLKRKIEEQLFFSTKVELKINGMVFRPSICYKVPPLAKKSLEAYAQQKKVVFYPAPVRFVNGALAPALTAQKIEGVASVVKETESAKPSKRKGK